MLPPALFYALGFSLVFFGVLRLVYLGMKGTSESPRAAGHASEEAEADDGDEARSTSATRRGFGLLSFMGGGRMSGPKRHKVMGALWIVMGLYVGWTGYNMSRNEELVRSRSHDRGDEGVRVIRANVKADRSESPAPAEGQTPHDEAPSLRAAPAPAPQ